GAVARHVISARTPKLGPWNIACINVTGSICLGLLSGLAAAPLSPRARLLLGTGLCGGFTTFSTYAVDIVKMLEQGQVAKALGYATVNNAGAVMGAGVSIWAVKRLKKVPF
ncbi:unnamed protein product, partial [Chrysoparadoxa australica]